MLALIRARMKQVTDPRRLKSVQIELHDALMSAFGIFSLKFPSLLQFQEAFRAEDQKQNLKNLYGITSIPSDTQMREILDPIDPEEIRPAFNDVFQQVQRGGALKEMEFYKGHYLLAADGTGYFSSNRVHCDNCMKKKTRKSKKRDEQERQQILDEDEDDVRIDPSEREFVVVDTTLEKTKEEDDSKESPQWTYYHQLVGASIVHPDHSTVIPLCPEPIRKQDGQVKNDCESNATKRFLKKFREDHPKLKVIFIQDAIASNLPHIRELKNCQMSFILGVQPGSHEFLFKAVDQEQKRGEVKTHQVVDTIGQKILKKRTRRYRWVNGVLLNAQDLTEVVNFLEFWEDVEWINAKGESKKQSVHFSWVTDLEIRTNNLTKLVQGGRCRWKIENETFNTLKNQGYHFEHNYGHGYLHLTTVFAYLMMLAFLFDQVQQASCELFQQALAKCSSRQAFWEKLKILYELATPQNWTQFLSMVAEPKRLKMVWDTS